MVKALKRTALALSLVLLASCGNRAGGTITFSPPESPEPAPSTDGGIFQFEAARLEGGSQVTGAELQGKDVALWFWAPW